MPGPYDVYEIISSPDFSVWTRVGNPLLPTTSNGVLNGVGDSAGAKFFRVRRVP
jgi:hypothetical protein